MPSGIIKASRARSVARRQTSGSTMARCVVEIVWTGCGATIIAMRRDAALFFNQKTRHGYEIIKAIEEQSGGMYSPSPGVINPL